MTDVLYPFNLGGDTIVAGPCPRPRVITSPRVHLLDTDDPYADSQCDDTIADGDILVVGDVVVVMVSAWPLLVSGDGERYGFHTMREDADIRCLGAYRFGRRMEHGFGIEHTNATGGADYSESFAIARRLA